MPSIYRPLDIQKSEIRLLQIQSQEVEERQHFDYPDNLGISFRLCTVSLDENPRYLALSYVWANPLDLFQFDTFVDGQSVNISARKSVSCSEDGLSYHITEVSSSSCITIDGEEISITQNLGHALRRIVYDYAIRREDSYLIWIDALCIDQQNLEEKSTQIPLMARIYDSAFKVVAYLGTGNESVVHTIHTLEAAKPFLREVLDHNEKGEVPDLAWMWEFPQIWDDSYVDEHLDNTFWRGLRLMFSYSYWYRAWVFQEMVLSSFRLEFVVGSTMGALGIETLLVWQKVFSRISNDNIKRPVFFPKNFWKMKFLFDQSAICNTLNALEFLLGRKTRKGSGWKMQELRHFCLVSSPLVAGNPKDKIYALHSLMDVRMRIDYTDEYTVESLYVDFARVFVERDQLTDLLACAGIGKESHGSLFLPSWVPDWSHLSRQGFNHKGHFPNHLNIWDNVFHTHRGMNSPLPTVTGKSLRAQGCIFELATGYSFYSCRSGVFLEDFLNFCVQYLARQRIRRFLRMKKLFESTAEALQHIVVTLLRDLQPEVSTRLPKTRDRLHGRTERSYSGINLALLFLCCIADLHPRLDDVRQRREKVRWSFHQLGYDTPAQIFDDFPCMQQYPEVPHIAANTGPRKALIETPHDFTWKSFVDVVAFPLRLHPATFNVRRTLEHSLASRIMETSRGRLALVPSGTIEGDLICAIGGCRFPVVLRRVESSYIFLGGAFRYGLMDGEAARAIEDGSCDIQDFTIQ
jgi:hypothetical protein